MPDLRLAAIPHGPTDPRYRDRCEMRVLGLGHHGIVEWDPVDSEIPFWYAIAAVVCSPAREASERRAREASRSCRATVRRQRPGAVPRARRRAARQDTSFPSATSTSLQAALETVLCAEDEATRLGEAARRKAEAEYSPAAAARAQARVGEPGIRGTADVKRRARPDGIHVPSRSSSAAVGSAPSCSTVTVPS